MKAVIAGLLDRDGPPVDPSRTNAFVCKVTWAQIEPTQGTLVTTAIDSAISSAHSLNYPVKLRVYTGLNAPTWAKSFGGSPFQWTSPDGSKGTMGRWWNASYISAYAQLQQLLAARYDSEPLLRDVVIAGAGAAFPETLLRDAGTAGNVKSLLGAGFTIAADDNAIRSQISAHSVWTNTPQSMAFNPYQSIAPNGNVTSNENYTETIMGVFRTAFPTGVLGNNSLRSTTQGPDYDTLYAKIKQLGPPIYFQTATLNKIGSWSTTLHEAVGYGANYVELPSGYSSLKLATLQSYMTKLKANPV